MPEIQWCIAPLAYFFLWLLVQFMFGGVEGRDDFDRAFPSQEQIDSAQGREGCINLIFGAPLVLFLLALALRACT